MSDEIPLAPPPTPPSAPAVSRAKFNAVRIVRFSVLAIIFLFAWAYIHEIRLIRNQPLNSWTDDVSADCAVVVTGGPNRIREGVDLLLRHAVQKLIISGVHPQASFRDIFPLWPFYGEIRDQDIILERRSRTTYGNAQQTLPLVEALRCRDLVLITSRAHMRRALGTFRAEFPPGFPIIPRTVVSVNVDPTRIEITYEAIKSLFYSVWAY